MGIAPWGSLGSGAFKTEEQRKAQDGRKVQPNEAQAKVSSVLESIANRKNTKLWSVALAYVMHKTPNVYPIVGGRTVEQLKSNIEALELSLSKEDIEEIEGALPFDPGFPTSFLYPMGPVDNPRKVLLLGMAGTFDYVPLQQPIKPSEG